METVLGAAGVGRQRDAEAAAVGGSGRRLERDSWRGLGSCTDGHVSGYLLGMCASEQELAGNSHGLVWSWAGDVASWSWNFLTPGSQASLDH